MWQPPNLHLCRNHTQQLGEVFFYHNHFYINPITLDSSCQTPTHLLQREGESVWPDCFESVKISQYSLWTPLLTLCFHIEWGLQGAQNWSKNTQNFMKCLWPRATTTKNLPYCGLFYVSRWLICNTLLLFHWSLKTSKKNPTKFLSSNLPFMWFNNI